MKLSANIIRSAAIILLFSISSCNSEDPSQLSKKIKQNGNEVWFKQANLSLGHRIEMINAEKGFAISRGKGDPSSGGEKGEFLIFENGRWLPVDNYDYSDFPIVKKYNSQETWYVTHETYNGFFKPHLYSYSNKQKREIELPQIMWDKTDYSMWFSLSFTPSGKAHMVGQKGNIIFYNGKTWNEIYSPVKNESNTDIIGGDLHDVFMINDSLGWAVGKVGAILKYSNRKWQIYNSPVDVDLNKVSFINENTGWIAGERGTILKYENGVWKNIKTEFRINFYTINIVNENKVYFAGAKSSIILFENGEWKQNESIKIFEDDFQDISIITENGKDKIWIIGNNGIYTNTQSYNFSFTDITSQASLRKEGVGGIFFDYNNDSYPELFLINEKSPNLFYENRQHNSFSEVFTFLNSKNDEQFFSQFNAFGDVNNDGFTDVLEVMDDLRFQLSFGEGNFNFAENKRQNYLKPDYIQSDLNFSLSAKFADFDNDGNLDLYISNVTSEDMLFKNDGTGNFKNVYKNSGINKFIKPRSFGSVFSDFDNDGFIDLLIIYRGPKNGKHISLFLNKGNFKFAEKDDPAFYVNVAPATFSTTVSDFNNDGFTDILVFNNTVKLKLLINNGDASFKDCTDSVGLSKPIAHPEPVNGIVDAADINNDGWIDLFVGSKLFLNSPEFHFKEIAEEIGINFTGNPSFTDTDNDGDMDLFIGSSVFSMGEGVRAALYRNNLIGGNFLKVKLNTDLSNRSGIGTKIFLTGFDKNGKQKYKTVKEAGLGSSPMLMRDFTKIHFGIDTSLTYSLEVKFPSGVSKNINQPEINKTVEVIESSQPAHSLILAGKSFNRTLLLIDWFVEIIKFILFGLFLYFLITYGLKTKAQKFVKKIYTPVALILFYAFLIHLTVEGGLYFSIFISFVFPSALFFAFVKITSDYIERKESKYISHYKLFEILGVGGTGKVFKAVDIHENKIVAVKVLNPQLMKDEENRRRLNSEGRLLSSMNHPNIVKVFEFGETEKHSFVAMEYLSGGTLEEFIEKNYPLSSDTIINIAEQVCSGLNEIHGKDILHRDLKSQNIMFDENNVVRIMDFGLSKSPLVSTMTSLGTVVGTLGYVAPEQVTNMYVDQRCDIFSFGVVMYQMITNKLPFTGENEIALIHSIFNAQPEKPSVINKECHEEIERITLKCIEKEPEKRFKNVDELLNEIAKLKNSN